MTATVATGLAHLQHQSATASVDLTPTESTAAETATTGSLAPDPTTVGGEQLVPWRVLVVDDDPDVHAVTKLALRRKKIDGRPIEFLCAASAADARQILATDSTIALVLLDVIMETEDAGLRLVRFIREVLNNRRCRIVLRTGQPDDVPQATVMANYDINDYKTKTELTQTRLFTTVAAALRSYRDIVALEARQKELEQLSESLRHQATHDPLTKLVNRGEFERRLLESIHSARKPGTNHALCLVDLDDFRVVNELYGHAAGDELLRQLGARLSASIDRNDTVARVGGDEFGLLLMDRSIGQARDLAESVVRAVRDFRFVWSGHSLHVAASIGLVPIDASCDGPLGLMRTADNLAYVAKQHGGNSVHVLALNKEQVSLRRDELAIRSQLTDAIENSSLTLHFQQIVPTQPGADQGHHYEVLVRMIDAHGDLVAPGVFLPVAEKHNLSVEVDRWVAQNTLAWLDSHPSHVDDLAMCSINLSAGSLVDPSFRDDLLDLVHEHPTLATKICFEITETAAIVNMTQAVDFIEAIRATGCRFALDDFGTGFCSFHYLKSLPVDLVKIDGVFVRDMKANATDLALVQSINDIAHVMGKQTVAEFVETPETLDLLREIGVDFAQGYAIARPVPLGD